MQKKHDLVFVGDINLGRLVHAEIEQTGVSPWSNVLASLPRGVVQVGNLEGVIGNNSESCLKSPDYCFYFPSRHAKLLSDAGFTLLGVANNHALDQGINGLNETRRSLQGEGLQAADLSQSPFFVSSDGVRYGLVFLNRIVDGMGNKDEIPSPRVAQALDLAKTGADWVIVYVHWGQELTPWVSKLQRDEAKWLVAHGADMIVGSHPHVIQSVDCIDGRPVWFSLGNHVFDQKYPITHAGGLIACDGTSSLRCKGYQSRTRDGSASIKEIVSDPSLDTPNTCIPTKKTSHALALGKFSLSVSDTMQDTTVDVYAHSSDKMLAMKKLPLRRLELFHMEDGSEALFTLLSLYSDLDRLVGLRPHVYQVTNEGIRALWRGSGLAFPLVDAIPVSVGNRDVLCALHAHGSFLAGANDSEEMFAMAYKWVGFGFAAERNDTITSKCQTVFGERMHAH